MDKELELFLKYYIIKEFECKEEDWLENLTEILNENVVHTKKLFSHRWYDSIINVSKIGDKFIQYEWYYVTGDTHISDMGLELELSTVCEVEQKTKTITVTYYE